MVVNVLLENLHEDFKAFLFWRQFSSLNWMDFRLSWQEDLANKDFVEELDSHNLG